MYQLRSFVFECSKNITIKNKEQDMRHIIPYLRDTIGVPNYR